MKVFIFLIFISAQVLLGCKEKGGIIDEAVIGNKEYPTPTKKEPIAAIQNPERGFFVEANYFIHNLEQPWNHKFYPEFWLGEEVFEKYNAENDQLSELQLYVYLTEYVGKDIDETAFDNLQLLFDDAREKGFKFLFRFAYDYNPGATQVTFEDIFRHLDQWEPFIRKNIGMIDIWQIGMIGAWGEGHSSPLADDWANRSKLAKRILEIFTNRHMTIRYPRNKEKYLLTADESKRCGFHNDYFTAWEHPKAPGSDYMFGTAEYSLVEEQSPYLKVLGEIPYAENTQWGLHEKFSVNNAIKALRDHHYSTFDLTQNHWLNIKNWKSYYVSASMLSSQDVVFEEEYFLDAKGEHCYRTAYEFIRDHLGYRLYFDKDKTKLTVSGTNLEHEIHLRNVGFSAIHNPRPVYLAFLNQSGEVVHTEKLDVDPSDWQPYDPVLKDYKAITHETKGTVSFGERGQYKVGLWLPDPTELLHKNPKYAIQFANREIEILEKDGYRINVLDTVMFQ